MVDRLVPASEPSPEVALSMYAQELATAIERTLPGWVDRCVARVADAWQPGLGAELSISAERAGREAVDDVAPRIRALLLADVDDQATGPLEICRSAVRFPTRVLSDAGVSPVERDEFSVRAFPDDVYGLVPAKFGDIDPAVGEPGLVWGAAKAHVVMARRRDGGGA